MNSEPFRPYTQTHTLTFKRCRKLDKLLSQLGEQAIQDMWIKALQLSGFEIPRDDKGNLRVQCHPFGENFGYTATAILTSSDATMHTYPEREYNRTAQVKFNLCYLKPEVEGTHNAHVDKAFHVFRRLTGCRNSMLHSAPQEYL